MTKPARGSARSSKQPPRGGGQGGKKKLQQVYQKPLLTGVEAPDTSKRGSALADARKSKAQEKWKPLLRSTVVTLDNMLGLSILSVLSMKVKEKEEAQKHLNILKDQFLEKCSRLRVPAQKYANLAQVSQQFRSESQNVKHGQKKIEALEESSRAVVRRLEELQVRSDRLEHERRVLRDRLEDAESDAQQFLQLNEQNDLHLPALPKVPHDEPTLQKLILNAVPDPHAAVKVLQSSGATGDVRAFLELAHLQTDRLLTRR
ncbi:centromere protein Q [Trichomycterus rosablanca]|uniref:centromere protein Q n=1 Tax=Trichomycterus rosablanca TaxID=2290929 RepID=UPI002F35C99F